MQLHRRHSFVRRLITLRSRQRLELCNDIHGVTQFFDDALLVFRERAADDQLCFCHIKCHSPVNAVRELFVHFGNAFRDLDLPLLIALPTRVTRQVQTIIEVTEEFILL